MTTRSDQPQHEAPFFTSVRGWGIVRGDNRVFGGVVEAVGDRIGMDRVPARIIAVILALITSGFFLTAYAVAWAILPDTKGRIIIQDFGRGTPNVPAIVGIGIFALLGLNSLALPTFVGFGIMGTVVSGLIGLAMVVGIIALIAWAIMRGNDGHTRIVVDFRGTDEARAKAKEAGEKAKEAGQAAKDAAFAARDDVFAAGKRAGAESKAAGKKIAEEAKATAKLARSAADEIRAAVTIQSSPASEDGSGEFPPVPPFPPIPPMRPRVPGPGKAIRLLAFSASLLSAAAIWFLDRHDRLPVNAFELWLAVAVIIVGGAIILAGAAGRRIGIFGFYAFVLVIGWSIRITAGPEIERWMDSHELMVDIEGAPGLVSVPDGTIDCRDYDSDLRELAVENRIDTLSSGFDVEITDKNTTVVVPEGAYVRVTSDTGDVAATVTWELSNHDTWAAYSTCEISGPIATFYRIGDDGVDVDITIASSVRNANIVIEEN